MRLDFETIKSITCGAAQVAQTDEGVRFYRFTRDQADVYRNSNEVFFNKSKLTSGVKLRFRTDSTKLSIKASMCHCTRTYYSWDVFVGDTLVGTMDNFSDMELPADYSEIPFPTGEASAEFDLGEGDKLVTIYLPWSMKTYLRELSVDDGAYVEPVKYSKKLLVLGDSITCGLDALHPSKRYISRLCDALDAEEFNKAIGGERFCPELVKRMEDWEPDYIVVAYGTNDWRNSKKDAFEQNCEAFFEELYSRFANVKTFVITPIWRADLDVKTDFASFHEIEAHIRNVTSEMKNVVLIRGYDLVPHSPEYFGDERLHPNEAGFDHYFRNLYAQIQNYI